MALAKAVAIGAIAAIATPYLMREASGSTPLWLLTGAMHVEAGGLHLYWSWPLFCAVTLTAWVLMRSVGAR